MAEAKSTGWDGQLRAPAGTFRVIGTDKGDWPWEDYWVGDFASLDEAKSEAQKAVAEMNPAAVWDDQGRLKYAASAKK